MFSLRESCKSKRDEPSCSVSPPEGLHSYVKAWEAAIEDAEAHGKRFMTPSTLASFKKLLSAVDTYISEELEPTYAQDPIARIKLDHYWAIRHSMYAPSGHTFPLTNNGTSVARLYIDCWMTMAAVAAKSEAYKAVEEASNDFHIAVYNKPKSKSYAEEIEWQERIQMPSASNGAGKQAGRT